MGLAIIYLYDSTVKTFIYNGQPLPQAYDVVVDRTLNDEFFVVGKHPLDTKNKYKDIQKDKIIKAHTPDGMQPFRIMDVTKGLGYVEFESWPLLYADLRSKLVKPFTIKKGTGQHTLNTFVSQLLLPADFSFTSNILTTHDFIVRDATEAEQDPDRLYDALDVLKRIVKRWNAEVIIDGFDIRLVNRLGKDTDALLYEKKNITDFMDNESLKNIVTRVHGKAEWTEDGPDGKLVTKRLTAQVDSPLINEYSGIVFEQQFTNNDVRTQQQLNDWLNLKFTTENLDKPSRTIELDTNIVDDTKIALGDKLNLKYLKHDVDMLIRMTRYQYDGFNNRYLKTYVGDAAEQFTGSVQNSITSSETNIKNSVDKKVANIIVNELGQKIIYSEVKPEGNFREGDTWFDEKGGMFIWDEASANWIPHPYNRRLDVVAQEIEENNKQLEAEKVRIDQTITKADQAVADSGLAKVDASNAITNANQAITDASKALTDANTSLTQSGQAKTDASLAMTNAANAVTQAQTADGKANSALTKANAAITDLGTTNSKVSNLETGYNELTNTVSLKADSTTVNAVKGMVDNHTLAISANEQALTLKASSSEVNTLKGTVSDHSLSITAQADALTLKASQTEVNTIKGTVDQHGLDIAANAREVSLRLTSTQVNSLVDGKNYVNQTELKATSDGLSLDITKVSTDLGNLEIGGRNLLLKTKSFGIGFNDGERDASVDGFSVIKNNNITGSGEGRLFVYPFEYEEEEEYVLSFWAKGLGQGKFIASTYSLPISSISSQGEIGSDAGGKLYFDLTEEWERISIKIKTKTWGGKKVKDTHLWVAESSELFLYGLQIEKGNKATDWTPAPEDMATLEQYTSLEATVDGLGVTVGNKASQASVNVLANQVSTKVESATYTSKMTQLDSAINLRVQKGDVIGQINVEAGTTLIQNNKLYLDAQTVYFSGKAFIPNAAIIDLNADKITTGSLNAADVNIINLNVSNLVGNTTDFVRSAWNSIDASLTIDATSGIRSTSTAGADIEEFTLTNGRIELRSTAQGYDTDVKLDGVGLSFTTGQKTARMRYNGTNIVMDNGSLGMNYNHINSVDWIRIIGQPGDTMDTSIFNSPNHPGSIISDSRQITIGLGTREEISRVASFGGNIQFMKNLFMNGNTVSGAHAITFDDSTTMLASSIGNLGGGALIDGTAITIGLRTSGDGRGHSRVAEFYGQIHFYRNLYMNGKQVVDTSDGRLKKGIVASKQDSLSMIKNLDYKNFYWRNEKISKEKQFGLIAQDVDESLQMYNARKDEYGINQSRLIHTAVHAIQQLNEKQENTLKVASHAMILADKHKDELTCHKKRIKELEERVKQLEGVA